MADGLLCATGYDEISLLSLSSGDYSRIEPLLATLMERYYEKRVALALPSLRAETLTRASSKNIRRVRKTSFTLAPEAGTQRLRNIINKGNIRGGSAGHDGTGLCRRLEVRQTLFHARPARGDASRPGRDRGSGLPDAEDGKQRGQVTVSLSTFVPKPHTPFQWAKTDRPGGDQGTAVLPDRDPPPQYQRQVARRPHEPAGGHPVARR